ncbi:MAG TPA: glycosyltransferase family 9 protein [Casimicrobiaceae bacterium]|jgi:lipopolysaccharide heptosyltransferase II|nr:glycosyltransferase family 9 protein [Casimicrobiaceae bacterium]
MNAAWHSARSILGVRLDGIGDLLMTTPALRALKEARAERTLTLLTSPAAADAARELPFVDDVIAFVAPWMKSAERSPVAPHEMLALAEGLRARAFDAAVVFTVFSQSALPAAVLLHLAGIPRRAAYCRENPYALLTDWRPDPDRDAHAGVRHEVRRQIDLVESLGVHVRDTRLSFPVRDDARRSMRAKARAAGMSARRRWLVVHPGATAASRRYPEDKLTDAVAGLQATGRFQIAIAGGDCDVACAQAIAASVEDTVVLAGRLDLPELAALIDEADIVVCNNSAPAHIAAAVGTPVVDLYALTNPQHTPWGVEHRVLSRDVECKFCLKSICPLGHPRCLADVSPDEIVAAVEVLAPATANRSPRAGVAVDAGAQP